MKKITKQSAISKNPTDNLNKIRYYDRVSNVNALVLGKLLKENVDNCYWEKLGYSSFTDFVAQGNFSFSRRTAYNYIDLWGMFVKWKIEYDDFIKIPYSKLLMVKDVIDKDNLDDWIAKAEVLSRTDLQLEVREAEVNEGEQEFKPLPKIYWCKDCGGLIIDVDPEDLCKCGKGLTIKV